MKIAIIGAGICGLYLSWKLAEKGHEVTVFEKREKVGKEACSGLFSERILNFIPESQKLIENQIDYCLIHFPQKTLKITFKERFLVVSHFKLDNLVADLTQKAGAKIILNHNVTKPDLVTFQNKFDRIIGCDGANSIIRKSLGLREPSFRLAIQGFIPKSDYSDSVETWPVNQGFVWKIPRGEETEYGIISEPKEAKLLFNRFLKTNNLHLERIRSGVIPQGLIIPKNSSITLCGDAAGLCKPWSGGGVIWGLTAADLLLKNFPDFLKYRNQLKRFFLTKIILSKIATKAVYFLGFNFSRAIPQNIKIKSDFLF